MKELVEILFGFAVIAGALWLFLKAGLLLEDLGQRLFGPSFHWGRRRVPKIEIQTLFDGNTKDKDQI